MVQGRAKTVVTFIARNAPRALLAWVIAALAVRMTIRDRLPGLSVLFYMTPLIVAAALSGIAGLIWLRRRCLRLSGVAGGLALILALWWHASNYAQHPVPPDPAGERVVFWNAGRGVAGWAAVADQLRGLSADVIGLVEAGPRKPEMEQFWRDRFTGYDVCGPEQGMVLMAKGTVVQKAMGTLGTGGKYGHYGVQLEGRALDVLLVDIKSNPFRSRREAFASLTERIDALADRPLLLMGDFNTPVDSVFVAPVADRLVNAFPSCGNGYHVTWPVPVPVLALDQVWASPRVKLRTCELPWTWRSDHRPVVVTLAR